MNKAINELTSTRGIAALIVVLFHFGRNNYLTSLITKYNLGSIAVGYFFVLSGFILYYVYNERQFTYTEFIKKRIGRIVPVYVVALILSSILPSIHTQHNFLRSFLLNVTFLQSYFPRYSDVVINSPGWSLCSEMLFYILFPFFLKLSNKSVLTFVVFTASIFLLTQVMIPIVKFYLYKGYIKHPFFHLNEFLIGMVGAIIVKKQANNYLNIPPIIILIIICMLAYISKNEVFYLLNGIYAPLFIILILSIVKYQPQTLNNKYLVYLGDISYSVYILHVPVYYYFNILNIRLLHLSPEYVLSPYIIILLVLSALSYRYIEMPLRHRISNSRYFVTYPYTK